MLKVQIQQADFFHLVSQAYGLIEKRTVMPILSKVLISAKKGALSIQATDQDNSLQSQVSAEVETPGKAVVDAQSLYDILKELPEGEIHLSGQKGHKVRIEKDASVFHLLSMNVRDFPVFPPFQLENSFQAKTSDLKNFIESTAYCSSVDETSYHLTGVFFEKAKKITGGPGKKGESCFRFVATDGHRLGLSEMPFKESILENGVIISKKGVQEIRKLLSQATSEEEVEIALNPPQILFRYGEAILSVKLVEGGYPDYRPFIPRSSAVTVELEAERFYQVLKRVSLLSSTRFKGVNFQIMEKKILMEAENPDLGSAQDEVACVRKKGKDLKVRFNARYVLEALGSLSSKRISMNFGGKEKPCVIQPVSSDKKESQASLCVVMPMKI